MKRSKIAQAKVTFVKGCSFKHSRRCTLRYTANKAKLAAASSPGETRNRNLKKELREDKIDSPGKTQKHMQSETYPVCIADEQSRAN